MEQAAVGKRHTFELVFTTVFTGGHVLLEDNPGLDKILVTPSMAQRLGLDVTRSQFTSDPLPANLTDSFIYDQGDATLEFRADTLFPIIVTRR